MSTDIDQPNIEADPDERISVERWDEIIGELGQITETLGLLDGRLSRLEQLLPDVSG
jgi:hypothetical protein